MISSVTTWKTWLSLTFQSQDLEQLQPQALFYQNVVYLQLLLTLKNFCSLHKLYSLPPILFTKQKKLKKKCLPIVIQGEKGQKSTVVNVISDKISDKVSLFSTEQLSNTSCIRWRGYKMAFSAHCVDGKKLTSILSESNCRKPLGFH